MSLLLTGFESLAEIGINMWLGGVGSLVSMIWIRNLAKLWNCSNKKRQHTLVFFVSQEPPSGFKNNTASSAGTSTPSERQRVLLRIRHSFHEEAFVCLNELFILWID